MGPALGLVEGPGLGLLGSTLGVCVGLPVTVGDKLGNALGSKAVLGRSLGLEEGVELELLGSMLGTTEGLLLFDGIKLGTTLGAVLG